MPVPHRIAGKGLPQQFAPARAGLLHAEAEEAQPVLRHDRPRHREDSPRQQHRRDVGQQMAEHDPPRRHSGNFTALDVRHRALLERFAAHQKRRADPPRQPQHAYHHRDRRQRIRPIPQRRHQYQQQEKRRKAHQYLHDPHHHQIEPPPPVSGSDADRRADHDRERGGEDADRQRGARSVDQPGGDVAAYRIASHRVARARSFVGAPDLLERGIRQRSEYPHFTWGLRSFAVVELVHARLGEAVQSRERQYQQQRKNRRQPPAESTAAARRRHHDRGDRDEQREVVETQLDEDVVVGGVRREEVVQKRHRDPAADDRQQRAAVGDERGEYRGQDEQRQPDHAEAAGGGGEKLADCCFVLRHASPCWNLTARRTGGGSDFDIR